MQAAILPIEASEGKMMEESKGKMLEESDSDEGLGETKAGKRQQRRMKARRARRKAYRPYYQLTEEQRRVREERERLRELKQRERMVAKGRITAPYNTTQFLMSDNKADNILLQLEEKLEARRVRHNSLSTEEVEEAEKEEAAEFMSRQFKADYQLQHLDRLESMTKELLLHEYMLLERKNEALEEKLEFMRGQEEEKARRGLVDYNFEKGEYPMDPETAEKIKNFQRVYGILTVPFGKLRFRFEGDEADPNEEPLVDLLDHQMTKVTMTDDKKEIEEDNMDENMDNLLTQLSGEPTTLTQSESTELLNS